MNAIATAYSQWRRRSESEDATRRSKWPLEALLAAHKMQIELGEWRDVFKPFIKLTTSNQEFTDLSARGQEIIHAKCAHLGAGISKERKEIERLVRGIQQAVNSRHLKYGKAGDPGAKQLDAELTTAELALASLEVDLLFETGKLFKGSKRIRDASLSLASGGDCHF